VGRRRAEVDAIQSACAMTAWWCARDDVMTDLLESTSRNVSSPSSCLDVGEVEAIGRSVEGTW